MPILALQIPFASEDAHSPLAKRELLIQQQHPIKPAGDGALYPRDLPRLQQVHFLPGELGRRDPGLAHNIDPVWAGDTPGFGNERIWPVAR